MKSTPGKFTLTALAYIVPTMLLGYVWHLVIFKDLYDNLGIYNRTQPIIPLGFFSMIIQGLIIAYLYSYYAASGSTVGKAIAFSLIIGLFLFSVSTLANAAKIQVTSMTKWFLIQAAFHLLQFVIAGVLIATVNRRKPETSDSKLEFH
jgi:hypothetical protein